MLPPIVCAFIVPDEKCGIHFLFTTLIDIDLSYRILCHRVFMDDGYDGYKLVFMICQ